MGDDLRADSLERRNLARDPTMAPVRQQMRAELRRLVLEAVGIDR